MRTLHPAWNLPYFDSISIQSGTLLKLARASAEFISMLWLLAIVGIAAVLGLAVATFWGVREVLRSNSSLRLERRLNPADVLELNQAFARIQRDVLYGD